MVAFADPRFPANLPPYGRWKIEGLIYRIRQQTEDACAELDAEQRKAIAEAIVTRVWKSLSVLSELGLFDMLTVNPNSRDRMQSEE
jgi:hypothetical protein